jgi:hypothetical protein
LTVLPVQVAEEASIERVVALLTTAAIVAVAATNAKAFPERALSNSAAKVLAVAAIALKIARTNDPDAVAVAADRLLRGCLPNGFNGTVRSTAM